tara:strand:- start:86 stop:517 length:432 start_codon:yes stop_codon:yes gene_type:complete
MLKQIVFVKQHEQTHKRLYMKTKLIVNQISIEGYNEKMFVPFFKIDNDFSENEEYFRKDTIPLGFENEAERCSKELYDKYFSEDYDGYQETLEMALEEGSSYNVGGSQFILGNDTYIQQYEITAICLDNHHNDYIVIISYMTK